MDIPFLKDNQFAVGKAEYATGHILQNDNSLYRNGQDLHEMYEIFESYKEAEEFVIQKTSKYPEIECWIVDSKGEHVLTYDKNGERKFPK
jgi:hypothetical protein